MTKDTPSQRGSHWQMLRAYGFPHFVALTIIVFGSLHAIFYLSCEEPQFKSVSYSEFKKSKRTGTNLVVVAKHADATLQFFVFDCQGSLATVCENEIRGMSSHIAMIRHLLREVSTTEHALQEQRKKQLVSAVRSVVATAVPLDSQLPSQDRLLSLFKYRAENYSEGLTQMASNLKYQGVLIILSLVIILKGQRAWAVPHTDIKLPAEVLHYLVPGLLVYLWLQFGYLVNSLIETWRAGMALLTQVGEPASEEWNSAAFLFLDGGFMDAWFSHCTYQNVIVNNYPELTGMFFSLIFGVLLAATHACAVTLMFLSKRRYPAQHPAFKPVQWLLPWLVLAVFVASHFAFAARTADRQCWFTTVLAGLTLIFVYMLC